MDINVKQIGEQIFMVHFCIKDKSVLHNIEKIDFTDISDDEIKNTFVEKYIEEKLLEEKLVEKGYYSIGVKETRYLIPYNENSKRPIIGVAKFMIMPEAENLYFPQTIPFSINQDIQNAINNIDSAFAKTMINQDMYNLKEAETISWDSVVSYCLIYSNNGEVLNTINNQSFDMEVDDDIDASLFMGAKIGDKVIIDSSEIIIEAEIKDIKDKEPFTEENYDKELVEDYGYESFEDMREKFYTAYRKMIRIEKYCDYIISFITEHSNLPISNNAIAFYEKKPYSIYDDEYANASNRDEQIKAIKKSIIFDIVKQIISAKTETNNFDSAIFDLYATIDDYTLSANDDLYNETSNYIDKITIVKFCEKNQFIKGIKLE